MCFISFFIWDKNGIKIPNARLIHIACFSGSYDCVKYLIRCSADVGILDVLFMSSWRSFIAFFFIKFYFIMYRTPVYIATIAGFPQIVNLLLEHGADPNLRDVPHIMFNQFHCFSFIMF